MRSWQRSSAASIRFRIMACVITAIAVMGSCLIVTVQLNQKSMERIGGSYTTNAELTEVTALLADTERALEAYMEYRTFESIDSYYHFLAVSESAMERLHESPSTDSLLQKEYIVRQLTGSFFAYSLNAVTAQRANDSWRSEDNYRRSLQCYALLQSEVEELNMMFMRRNAADYAQNQGNFLKLARVSIAFTFIFFSLVLLLLYTSITLITTPLSDISAVALRVANMDFDIPLFNSQAQDEIGNICRAFDRMIVSIREYIDKIWEKAAKENELKERELEMRELYSGAQLRALQNQINPHFLFNTLNTGAQLAMIEGADKTCYFIEQVADFFRYNIQQKGQAATIDEELALIDNFIYIMKVRFGDRFEFIKEIPAGPHPQRLPRMTLQPLVEDCIKHGLNGAKGKVTLGLEQDIYFTHLRVSDNGGGFPPELRRRILSGESPAAADDSGSANALGAAGTAGATTNAAGAAGTAGSTANALEASSTAEVTAPDTPSASSAAASAAASSSTGAGNTSAAASNAGATSNTGAGTGTGLQNVISRLRLYFHSNDVFDILGNADGGTTFLIRIPNNV